MPQLRFKTVFHDAILAGRKTTTLRRWQNCRVGAGDRVYAPGVGWLVLDGVEEIEWDQLTEDDAKSDGFESLADLNRAIRRIYPKLDGDGKQWFKLRFHLHETAEIPDDPKSATRRELAAAVRAELDKAVQLNRS